MDTVECTVSGIRNKQQKIQLKNALDKIDGVSEVSVDPATSIVKVGFNEPATESLIKDCIEDTGFEITNE